MSRLMSNKSEQAVLDYVKSLTRVEILNRLNAIDLKEYGVYHKRSVADIWQSRGSECTKIIGALNNIDTAHVLLAILKDNTLGVLTGLAIASHMTQIETLEIVLPENNQELVQKIQENAAILGIKVQVSFGIVDVIKEKRSIIHHLETLVALTDYFYHCSQLVGDYTKSFVFSVTKVDGHAGKVLEQSTEVSLKQAIETYVIQTSVIQTSDKEELAGNPIDFTKIKAIGIGTKIYPLSILEQTIDDNMDLDNGLITLYDTTCCMADQAEMAILKVRKIECGKCTFCREGSLQIHAMLKDITHGKGNISDIGMIKEIGDAVSISCLCSVGLRGATTVIDALSLFGEEIENHVRKKNCQASVCSAFMNIYIDPIKCDGCEDCTLYCPVNCIEGKSGFIHMIDEFDCTKCGLCIPKCPVEAIIKTTGRLPKLPERLTRVGRFAKR